MLVTYESVQANISADNSTYEIDIDSLSGVENQCNGQICFPLSPETVVRETRVVLSKSFVHDIGLILSTCVASNAPVDAPADDGSIKCHHSNDRLKVKDMRMYVGRHILIKTLASPHSVSTCGYCGRRTCISTLVISSQQGQKSITTWRLTVAINFNQVKARQHSQHEINAPTLSWNAPFAIRAFGSKTCRFTWLNNVLGWTSLMLILSAKRKKTSSLKVEHEPII